MQKVRFIAKYMCDKWIAVNLIRLLCIASVRWMREEIKVHTHMLEEYNFTNKNLVFVSLLINIEKFCHSCGCSFLRNLSRKLSSVRIGLLVSYCSHLHFLLTACPKFYLNHEIIFL